MSSVPWNCPFLRIRESQSWKDLCQQQLYSTEIVLLTSWKLSFLEDKTSEPTGRILILISLSLVLLFTQNILKEEKELFWLPCNRFITQRRAGNLLLAFSPQTCFLMHLFPRVALTKYHKVGSSEQKFVGSQFSRLWFQNQDDGKAMLPLKPGGVFSLAFSYPLVICWQSLGFLAL